MPTNPSGAPADDLPPCDLATPGVARYLVSLHELQSEADRVTLTALAARLGVSVPSAHEMVARLERSGYLQRKPLRLTQLGVSAALVAHARRQAAERLVRDVLGMTGAEARREADRLAQSLSPELGRQLSQWHARQRTHGDETE